MRLGLTSAAFGWSILLMFSRIVAADLPESSALPPASSSGVVVASSSPAPPPASSSGPVVASSSGAPAETSSGAPPASSSPAPSPAASSGAVASGSPTSPAPSASASAWIPAVHVRFANWTRIDRAGQKKICDGFGGWGGAPYGYYDRDWTFAFDDKDYWAESFFFRTIKDSGKDWFAANDSYAKPPEGEPADVETTHRVSTSDRHSAARVDASAGSGRIPS